MGTQQSFDYFGKAVSYHIYGKGIPVLLLHGFGEDSRIWHNQIESLAEFAQLIVPDLPGSGQAAFNAAVSNSIDEMGKAMLALMSAIGAKKFMVLGHSMGGYVAMAMLANSPDSLSALGLVHSSAAADDAAKKEARKKAIDFVKENGAYAFLKTAIPNLFSSSFKQTNQASVNQLILDSEAFSDAAIIAYYEAMIARPDRTHLLKDIAIPVLFLLGKEDEAVPMKNVLPQTHLAAKSHVHIMACGHMGMLELPNETNDYLLKFITENKD